VKIVDGETAHVTLGAPPRSPVRVFGAVTIGGKPLANTSLNVARRLTGGQWAAHDVATRSSGEYEVVLEEPGDWGFFLRSNSVSSGRHVAIPAGASYELDVALPSGSISGRVLGANGEPLPVVAVRLSLDASVAELSSDAAGGVVATDVAGHFRFEGLPAGTYALATQGLNRSESEPVHGELHKQGLVLAAGAALEGIELKLEKAGRIEGLVFDATGSPAPNARVFVRDQHGEIVSSSGWSSTSASGRFEVAGLSPGSYTVFARTDALCSNESAPIVIASDDSAHVELTLQPSALLRVIVDDEHGHPTGAMIGVVDAHGRDFGPSNPANDMSGESGEGDDMSRTFGPLPPGTYSVSATNHDKVSVRADTQLAPGEQRTVTLRFGG
jgi:uncharacterized protein (DUF2141 family)